MKGIKILSTGVLLTIGFMFLMVAFVTMTEKSQTERDRDAMLGGFVLGVPATVAGGFLAWSLYRDPRQRSQERLQVAFFRIIKANQGQITPLELAMETGVSGKAAKAYLDERAKEFSANFDVDDAGNIYYRFGLIPGGLPGNSDDTHPS